MKYSMRYGDFFKEKELFKIFGLVILLCRFGRPIKKTFIRMVKLKCLYEIKG